MRGAQRVCSAQYQYRSDFERQHLQLFVHVAVKKRFVAASAGVRSSWRFGSPGFSLVCYRPLGPFVRQALEGDNDILYLCPQTRTTRLGLAGFGAKLRSHHKLFKTRDRPLARRWPASSSPADPNRSDTYTKTGAALTPAAATPTTPEAGHPSRRQHIIILYFIAICRAPKAS